MSNDWWTSSQSYSTPQRPSFPHSASQGFSNNQSQLGGGGVGQRARFAGDELDPEDLKLAENIKFLPSFAQSPAGKLALGTSPQSGSAGGNGNGQGLSGSPGDGGRRSPTMAVGGRFGGGGQERDSPRHTRARTLVHQNSGLSSSVGATSYTNGGGMAIDEDMPPTASLRDSMADGPVRSEVATPIELPTPPSLLPSPTTTSLHIFGPPPSVLQTLEPFLSQFGQIASYRPGPPESNWWIVDYTTPLAASYALRRHGEIINGKYMLGLKVVREGSTAGCSLLEEGQSQQQQQMTQRGGSGAGTPLRIQNRTDIIKPKQQAVQPTNKTASTGAGANDYAWDEPEQEGQSGWSGWVSERLFGR
ncbi:hypothetical protein IAR55_005169 [Kwoniella newhampshirensis]|uniref:RRM Nup35-type domain-containing protein n=1 Tax=Kwoniella newhampshirensis TaxID=1651941 RepID=A0AAW0YUX8_9TREE